MVIITATEKEFNVEWLGLSTIDNVLRFAVKDSDMATVLSVFTDPEETASLVYVIDNMNNKTEYYSFTTFKGVDLLPGNSIVVSLIKGT